MANGTQERAPARRFLKKSLILTALWALDSILLNSDTGGRDELSEFAMPDRPVHNSFVKTENWNRNRKSPEMGATAIRFQLDSGRPQF